MSIDTLHVENTTDIIKLLLDLPLSKAIANTMALRGRDQCSLFMALTMEAIWNHRNYVVHGGTKSNLLNILFNLERRFDEHVMVANHSVELKSAQNKIYWKNPPRGVVKLNIDATVSKEKVALAVVARDEKGLILRCWAKLIDGCDPLVAEASALVWALQSAYEEHYQWIILKGTQRHVLMH